LFVIRPHRGDRFDHWTHGRPYHDGAW